MIIGQETTNLQKNLFKFIYWKYPLITLIDANTLYHITSHRRFNLGIVRDIVPLVINSHAGDIVLS